MGTPDLRTVHFQSVLRAAEVETAHPGGRLGALKETGEWLGKNPPLTAVLCGAVCLAILLVVRPPFVLTFEYDQDKPWKGKMSICWVSVLIVSLAASALVVLLPALASTPIAGAIS